MFWFWSEEVQRKSGELLIRTSRNRSFPHRASSGCSRVSFTSAPLPPCHALMPPPPRAPCWPHRELTAAATRGCSNTNSRTKTAECLSSCCSPAAEEEEEDEEPDGKCFSCEPSRLWFHPEPRYRVRVQKIIHRLFTEPAAPHLYELHIDIKCQNLYHKIFNTWIQSCCVTPCFSHYSEIWNQTNISSILLVQGCNKQ